MISRLIERLFILFFCFGVFVAKAQGEFKSESDLIQQSEKLFLEGKYEEAYPLFSQLLALYQKDPNYNFKFGACMLYAEEDKEKPIKYLKYASDNLETDKEVFFFLGRAYQLNYRFKEAEQAYLKFKEKSSDKQNKKFDVVRAIETCNNGKQLLNKLTELTVLEKKEITASEFFRSYRLEGINGKIVVKTEDFCTELDLKRKDNSLMYVNADDRYIYFSSWGDNEKNSRDIYRAKRLPTGGFSPSENVGATINTSLDEDYPFMHPDGKTLYFCSQGHNSMGGYDIFKSTYDESTNTWSKPENVDFPINSPDDDMMFVTDTENKFAYFASKRSSKMGNTNVYKIKIDSKPDVLVMLKGKVTHPTNPTAMSKITVRTAVDKKLVGVFRTNTNGNYLIKLPIGGSYQLTVETDGATAQSEFIEVPEVKDFTVFNQEITYETKGDKTNVLVVKGNYDQPLADIDSQAEFLLQEASLNVNTDASIDSLKSGEPIYVAPVTNNTTNTKENITPTTVAAESTSTSNTSIVAVATVEKTPLQLKQQELADKKNQVEELKRDLKDIETEKENLKSQISRTKDKEIKAAFEKQVEDLETERLQKENDLSVMQVQEDNLTSTVASLNAEQSAKDSSKVANVSNTQTNVADSIAKNNTIADSASVVSREPHIAKDTNSAQTSVILTSTANGSIKNTTTTSIAETATPKETSAVKEQPTASKEEINKKVDAVGYNIVGNVSPTVQNRSFITDAEKNLASISKIEDPATRLVEQQKVYKELDAIITDEINSRREQMLVTKDPVQKKTILASITEYKDAKAQIAKRITKLKEAESFVTPVASTTNTKTEQPTASTTIADTSSIKTTVENTTGVTTTTTTTTTTNLSVDTTAKEIATTTNTNTAATITNSEVAVAAPSVNLEAAMFDYNSGIAQADGLTTELEKQTAKRDATQLLVGKLIEKIADNTKKQYEAPTPDKQNEIARETEFLKTTKGQKEQELITYNKTIAELSTPATTEAPAVTNSETKTESATVAKTANLTAIEYTSEKAQANLLLSQQLEQEVSSYNEQADSLRKLSEEATGPDRTTLVLQADEARTKAVEKEVALNDLFAESNKVEYGINNTQLTDYTKLYASNNTDKAFRANLLNEEAEGFFTQATRAREIAKNTTDIASKKDAQERAYKFEVQALKKQQESLIAFKQIGAAGSTIVEDEPSNVTVVNDSVAKESVQVAPVTNATVSKINTYEQKSEDLTNMASASTNEVEKKELLSLIQSLNAITEKNKTALANGDSTTVVEDPELIDLVTQRIQEYKRKTNSSVIASSKQVKTNVEPITQENTTPTASVNESATSQEAKVKKDTVKQAAATTTQKNNTPPVLNNQGKTALGKGGISLTQAPVKLGATTKIKGGTSAEELAQKDSIANAKKMAANAISTANKTNKTTEPAIINNNNTETQPTTSTKVKSTELEPTTPVVTNNPLVNNSVPISASETKVSTTELKADVFETKPSVKYSAANPIPVNPEMPQGLVFKVQIGAFRNPIPQDLFKGFTPLAAETTPVGLMRYTAGLFKNFKNANAAKAEIKGFGYKDAFVVAYYNGKRISYNEAMALMNKQKEDNTISAEEKINNTQEITEFVNSNPNRNNGTSPTFTDTSGATTSGQQGGNNSITITTPKTNVTNDIRSVELGSLQGLAYTVQVGVYSKKVKAAQLLNVQPLYMETTTNGYLRYTSGIFDNTADAARAKQTIVAIGLKDAFVTVYYNGKRITTTEAKKLEAEQGKKVFVVSPEVNKQPRQDASGTINESKIGNQ